MIGTFIGGPLELEFSWDEDLYFLHDPGPWSSYILYLEKDPFLFQLVPIGNDDLGLLHSEMLLEAEQLSLKISQARDRVFSNLLQEFKQILLKLLEDQELK